MSIQNLREYKAFKAGFALVVNDERYAKIVDQDGNEILFTPNPTVYGGTTVEVRWDDATKSWVLLNTPSPLDDRYAVGTDYVRKAPPVIGAVGDLFVPLDAAGNYVDPLTGVYQVELAYADAAIHPVLVIQVYEARLASYRWFLYIGEKLDSTTAATYLGYSEEELINALATDYVAKAQTFYDSTFGAGKVTITYDPATKRFDLDGLVSHDQTKIYGEKYGEYVEAPTAPLFAGGVELPMVVKVTDHNVFGFKPLRGLYLLFTKERLNWLPVVVQTAIDALGALPADVKEKLKRDLGVYWADWFRGMSQKFVYQGKEVVANVFMSVLASDVLLATVTIEDPANPGTYIDVSAVPLSLQDALTYEPSMEGFHKAWPDAMQYITGPYGALPIRDPQTGNIIGWLSDAYNY